MRRACKVTLKFASARKRRHVCALLQAYRAAVNFYIKSLWAVQGGLDKSTLARLLHTRLSARYKSQALKQALDIVVSTRRAVAATGKKASTPYFQGAAVLDAKFVSVEDGRQSFDLIIRLSGLHKHHRLVIPTKRTIVLNKWLAKPGAMLIQGCALTEEALILWVRLPDQVDRRHGKVLALDLGVNKLVVDSNAVEYGKEFKSILDKINRRKKGSKGRQRAYRERDNYIGRVLNSLPWAELKAVGVEDLRGLKQGKKKNRGRAFRRAIAPWVYRRVLTRIGHKTQENRVRLLSFPPAYTSQTCPRCGKVDRANRCREAFLCVNCGYSTDADYVGAQNGLVRTLRLLGSVESPRLKKVMQ